MLTSAQRNLYLTAFTLYLSPLLARTYYIILDHIHTQDEYIKLKVQVRQPSATILNIIDLYDISSTTFQKQTTMHLQRQWLNSKDNWSRSVGTLVRLSFLSLTN